MSAIDTFEPTQTFEPEGRAIPFVDEGAGPALVLLPGAGLTHTYLGTLAHVLTEEDFRVVRIGSRRPGAADTEVTLGDLAQDVVDVLTHLGIDDAWIGGHGFGGAIARAVSREHIDHVNGVLLLGADGPVPPTAEAARALQLAFSDAPDDEVLAAMPELTGDFADLAGAWNILRASRDPEVAVLQAAASGSVSDEERAALSDMVPVLVIQGSDDRITPVGNGDAVKAAAPGLASVTVVDGGGFLFAATHPGETSAIIEDYLDWD